MVLLAILTAVRVAWRRRVRAPGVLMLTCRAHIDHDHQASSRTFTGADAALVALAQALCFVASLAWVVLPPEDLVAGWRWLQRPTVPPETLQAARRRLVQAHHALLWACARLVLALLALVERASAASLRRAVAAKRTVQRSAAWLGVQQDLDAPVNLTLGASSDGASGGSGGPTAARGTDATYNAPFQDAPGAPVSPPLADRHHTPWNASFS